MCDGTEGCVDGSDEQQECDTGLLCACFESLSQSSIAVFLFRGFMNRSRNVSVLIFHFYLSNYSYG